MAADRQTQNAANPEERLEHVLCEYLSRINAGEVIDGDTLRREHPDLAAELLPELEVFQEFDLDKRIRQPLSSFGDFEILGEVGRGGMGVVYEAWQNSMNRRVALKVLPTGLAADERATSRFVREARLAGQVQHPNVVPVYGLGLEAESPYYTMQFVDGDTLARLLADAREAREAAGPGEAKPMWPEALSGRLSSFERESAGVVATPPSKSDSSESPVARGGDAAWYPTLALHFADVADGLQAAHAVGIVHRDLKPSNLILDSSGNFRILDFGLARCEGQDTITLSADIVGTPQYMSPEQARARKVPVDHRTDIYSLGATLYESLTGEPPFKGSSHQDTLSRILEREPQEPRRLVPGVARDLETIVLKCLRKEPRERYGTAEALAQDLRRFARGDAIEAQPMPRWERWLRKIRRHRLRIAMTLTVVLLAIVGGALALVVHGHRQQEREAQYEQLVRDGIVGLEIGLLATSGAEYDGESLSLGIMHPGDLRSKGWGANLAPRLLQVGVEKLEEACGVLPGRPEAFVHLSRGLHALGRRAEAIDALATALRVDPSFLPALLHHVRELRVRGEERNATKLFDAIAHGLKSDWERGWYDAHRAAMRADYDEAWRFSRDLLHADIEPPFAGFRTELSLRRGRVALKTDRHLRALKDFSHVMEDSRGAVGPTLLVATTHYLMKDREEAAAVLEDLLGSEPAPEVAVAVLECHLRFGEAQRAHAAAGRLRDAGARETARAQILLSEWKNSDALAAAERALAAGVEEPTAYEFLAEALVRLEGNLERARRVVGEGRARFPGDRSLREQLLRILYYQCKYDEANALILTEDPYSSASMLGWNYYRQGRLAEAHDVLSEFLADYPAGGGYLDGERTRVAGKRTQRARRGGSRPYQSDRPRLDRWESSPKVVSCLDPSILRTPLGDLGRGLRESPARRPRLTADPRSAALACAHKQEPDLELALDLARQAVEKAVEKTGRPTSEALGYLGEVEAVRGDTEAAILSFETAAALPGAWRSNDEWLAECRAKIYPRLVSCASIDAFLATIDDHDSRASAERLDAVRGGFAERSDLFGYLNARILERSGRADEASQLLEELVVDGTLAEEPAVLRLARLWSDTGRCDDALALLESRCLDKSTGSGAPWYEWLRAASRTPALSTESVLARLRALQPLVGPEDASSREARHHSDLTWSLTKLRERRILRIDCGAREDFTDGEGRVWSSDRCFDGGAEYGRFNPEMPGVSDPLLYWKARWFGTARSANPGYRVPVPNGLYNVTLHFCQVQPSPLPYRFTVEVEGHIQGDPIDPAADPGFARPFQRRFEVAVDDGVLDVVLRPLEERSRGGFLNALEIWPVAPGEQAR